MFCCSVREISSHAFAWLGKTGKQKQHFPISAEHHFIHVSDPYYKLLHKLEGASLSNLEKETIQENSFEILGRRTVVITVATLQVQDYVKTLNCFVKMSSGVRPIVFSLDLNLSKILKEKNVPSIELHHFIGLFSHEDMKENSTALFGTELFSIITHSKIWITFLLTQQGYDVIMTDLDVIWCKDMLKVFAELATKFPRIDIFMQSNQRKKHLKAQLNTGFYYAKSSKDVVELYELLVRAIPSAIEKGQDDQGLFWDLICCPPLKQPFCPQVKWHKYQNKELSLECHWNSIEKYKAAVKIQYLSLRDFPNGHADGFSRELNELPHGFYHKQCITQNITIWHVNFCTGKKKRRIMQRQGVFFGADWKVCKS